MAPTPESTDAILARKGRKISLIIAGAAIGFLVVEGLGAAMGWSGRTMALLELAVLGVFAWAAINAIMIWRKRQSNEDK